MSKEPFDFSTWGGFEGTRSSLLPAPARRRSSPKRINRRDGVIMPDIMRQYSYSREFEINYEDVSGGAGGAGRQTRFDSKVDGERQDDDALSFERESPGTVTVGKLCMPSLSPATHASSRSNRSPSDGTFSVLSSDNEDDCGGLASIGQWHCCKCGKRHELLRYYKGPHLVSILRCACPHKSCEDCTVSGQVQVFRPISDSAPIPFSDEEDKSYKRLHYGVCCSACGLSWRVQKRKVVHRRFSKMSISLHMPHPLEKLRSTKSMINLSRPDYEDSASRTTFFQRFFSKRGQTLGAMVKFSGIKCTCGVVTDGSSLMFKVLDLPKAIDVAKPAGRDGEQTTQPQALDKLTTTPELQARGHWSPTIRLQGGLHPNPLRSNLVNEMASPSKGLEDGLDNPPADTVRDNDY
ncbi:hypothetical protein P153DRAFT_392817 [Dothidotthia symphoricarpi CBS 119687]|uniref:Probable double zinc ribbon domain-containing protein n=1 Tax=Dothidotthia symphoricarpi CBS 119687 TaxID=1392245 RepID=A0A6A6AUJ4_9PLEO|nr:uncharacterized protein P153DRAFT_392817 [Dothidotthia symphoricarpi CBS 119687]KAF2134211.1 hypothetical protein P153DRAFT_392817 [Dothidotthia symphoricarpi CBS 119687]